MNNQDNTNNKSDTINSNEMKSLFNFIPVDSFSYTLPTDNTAHYALTGYVRQSPLIKNAKVVAVTNNDEIIDVQVMYIKKYSEKHFIDKIDAWNKVSIILDIPYSNEFKIIFLSFRESVFEIKSEKYFACLLKKNLLSYPKLKTQDEYYLERFDNKKIPVKLDNINIIDKDAVYINIKFNNTLMYANGLTSNLYNKNLKLIGTVSTEKELTPENIEEITTDDN